MLSKLNTFIGGKLAFQCQSSFSISPARHINRSRNKPMPFEPLFSFQWHVFGPICRRTNLILFRTNFILFRTNDFRTNDTFFGPMGRRTNGFSDQWVVEPMAMGCRTIDMAPNDSNNNNYHRKDYDRIIIVSLSNTSPTLQTNLHRFVFGRL